MQTSPTKLSPTKMFKKFYSDQKYRTSPNSSLNNSFNNSLNNSVTSESSESEYEHHLDYLPQSFLAMSNKITDLMASGTICTEEKERLIIPEIPRRCFTSWSIGKELAKGKGAVVYSACGEVWDTVARITQFKSNSDRIKFERDVKTRFYLGCKCKQLQITDLKDAFICVHKVGSSITQFGVTISYLYESDICTAFLNLSSDKERGDFITLLKTRLEKMVQDMHECGIVHRDIHQGNVLFRRTEDNGMEFALTDFEDSAGFWFGTSERVFSAYFNSDKSAVVEVISEMEHLREFLNGTVTEIDIKVLDDMGITLENLEIHKRHNGK